MNKEQNTTKLISYILKNNVEIKHSSSNNCYPDYNCFTFNVAPFASYEVKGLTGGAPGIYRFYTGGLKRDDLGSIFDAKMLYHQLYNMWDSAENKKRNSEAATFLLDLIK